MNIIIILFLLIPTDDRMLLWFGIGWTTTSKWWLAGCCIAVLGGAVPGKRQTKTVTFYTARPSCCRCVPDWLRNSIRFVGRARRGKTMMAGAWWAIEHCNHYKIFISPSCGNFHLNLCKIIQFGRHCQPYRTPERLITLQCTVQAPMNPWFNATSTHQMYAAGTCNERRTDDGGGLVRAAGAKEKEQIMKRIIVHRGDLYGTW